ncbi:hypothetical protein IEE91_13735 [Kocuria sp. cx-455]|uniref:hypothetical protein n=1 Tax=Kocuria sp. cx-455 TaxID=2771377 RepID=UPI0016825CA9|nr:hypothetical protein [Kocuria sp. cx-455]MBD2766224.1 hypothetical protein [Kocuria sp. cx-455]
MRTALRTLTAAVTSLFWCLAAWLMSITGMTMHTARLPWAWTARRGHFSWARAYGFIPGL